MAAIYTDEQNDLTVGITDLSRCTDLVRINSMIRHLRDDVVCDLIILSNTSFEVIEYHTDLSEHLEPGACSYKSTPVKKRCIPFNRTTNGEYLFTDGFIKQPCRRRSCERIDVREIWEQLRVRPFKKRELKENLGWAPGILENGEEGDWKQTSKLEFDWFHK